LFRGYFFPSRFSPEEVAREGSSTSLSPACGGSYKPSLTKREAAAGMEAMAGREIDPGLTRDFLKFVGVRRRVGAVPGGG